MRRPLQRASQSERRACRPPPPPTPTPTPATSLLLLLRKSRGRGPPHAGMRMKQAGRLETAATPETPGPAALRCEARCGPGQPGGFRGGALRDRRELHSGSGALSGSPRAAGASCTSPSLSLSSSFSGSKRRPAGRAGGGHRTRGGPEEGLHGAWPSPYEQAPFPAGHAESLGSAAL
ncbi:uncharacterized protein ACOB8E_009372 [Sarcophilus harrisii]